MTDRLFHVATIGCDGKKVVTADMPIPQAVELAQQMVGGLPLRFGGSYIWWLEDKTQVGIEASDYIDPDRIHAAGTHELITWKDRHTPETTEQRLTRWWTEVKEERDRAQREIKTLRYLTDHLLESTPETEPTLEQWDSNDAYYERALALYHIGLQVRQTLKRIEDQQREQSNV